MNPDTHRKGTYPSKKNTPKASNVATKPTFQHGTSKALPKQPFMSLAKNFDDEPEPVAYDPDDFAPEAYNRRFEASYGPNKQPSFAKHHHLDRPWEGNTGRQHLMYHGIDQPKRGTAGTPISRWISEPHIETPYHTVSSVNEDYASRFSKKSETGQAKNMREGGKAETR